MDNDNLRLRLGVYKKVRIGSGRERKPDLCLCKAEVAVLPIYILQSLKSHLIKGCAELGVNLKTMIS